MDTQQIEVLAYNIRFHRIKNHLSQVELAKVLGINQSMISSYENARNAPTLSGLQKMSSVFGITLDEFFYEPTEKEKNSLNSVTADFDHSIRAQPKFKTRAKIAAGLIDPSPKPKRGRGRPRKVRSDEEEKDL